MIDLTGKDFYAHVTRSSQRPLLVDFWAGWCGPCQQLGAALKAIEPAHPEVLFAKVDIDQNPDICQQLGISSVPCVILYVGGQEIDRIVGNQPNRILTMLRGTRGL